MRDRWVEKGWLVSEIFIGIMSDVDEHDWKIDGVGVWENYYNCTKCKERIRIDTDSDQSLPVTECEKSSGASQ